MYYLLYIEQTKYRVIVAIALMDKKCLMVRLKFSLSFQNLINQFPSFIVRTLACTFIVTFSLGVSQNMVIIN